MDLLGYNVLEEGSRRPMGTVADVLFDDHCRRVVALIAEHRGFRRQQTLIAFGDICRFSADTVIARGKSRFDAGETRDQQRTGALEGKLVVTSKGRYVGTVKDVHFHEASGRVMAFEITLWTPRRMCRRPTLLPVDSSLAIGDVIVVSESRRAGPAAVRIH
jgi:uncharacterized protein YrrD